MTNGTRCFGTVASVLFVLSAGCGPTIIEPPPPPPSPPPVSVAPSTLRLDLRESIQLQVTVAKALAEKGINIHVISTSEIKISVLIAAEFTDVAVRALHTAYGLDK